MPNQDEARWLVNLKGMTNGTCRKKTFQGIDVNDIADHTGNHCRARGKGVCCDDCCLVAGFEAPHDSVTGYRCEKINTYGFKYADRKDSFSNPRIGDVAFNLVINLPTPAKVFPSRTD